MRVLLDANILISYLLAPAKEGTIQRVVSAGLAGQFVLLAPGQLLNEMTRRIAGRAYLAARITPEELQQFVSLISVLAEQIPAIEEPIPAFTRDPKDDYLLAYALMGEADYLVTGDDDLVTLGQVGPLKIVTPRQFLSALKSSGAAG